MAIFVSILTCLLFTGQFSNACWDNTSLAFRPELRAFSTLGQPNWLGAYLAVTFFIGIYFLDVAEDFFALRSSPFRSVLFMGVYAIVSFFIVTSSSIALARGLVLSLYLQLLLWQVGEWRLTGSDASWYKLVADAVPKRTQEWLLSGFIVLFFVETYLFIR